MTAEDWVPTTWDMRGDWGATVTCPDDPAQAHSGRRCVRLKADQGVGHIIYGPLPCPDARPWTIRLWARGSGTLLVQGIEYLPDRWERLPDMPPVQVSDAWTQYELHVTPQAERRQWWLDIATQGKSDVWVDDVFAGYEGAASLGLPPDKPVGKDDSTLLYLDFEQPLDEDAFYIGGKAGLSADNEGRFGKCLNLGADGYVACSANENVDPAQGTIEVWCKFLTPGNDVVLRPIVSIPGPEGMSLHKDQYSHISFGFSSGWATLSNATALGYADRWQPGVWRHFAACWDKDLMQVFVDGKLVAWCDKPKLSRSLGPELRIGGAGHADR